ncbi:PadR family transcriptional regulator [Acidobacteriota bacterium]
MKELTKAEETVLLAILNLGDDAYGVALRQRIKKTTGNALPYGTLYFILDQLTRKAYVKRRTGESDSERGGRPRIYYTLTSKGHQALEFAYEMQQKVWDGYAEKTWGEETEK